MEIIMRLLIAIATLTLSGCLDAVGGMGEASGRTVISIRWDADGNNCYNDDDWKVNGGKCDCPDGFTPVGTVQHCEDGRYCVNTVCLED
jgi:hypothetical protein